MRSLVFLFCCIPLFSPAQERSLNKAIQLFEKYQRTGKSKLLLKSSDQINKALNDPAADLAIDYHYYAALISLSMAQSTDSVRFSFKEKYVDDAYQELLVSWEIPNPEQLPLRETLAALDSVAYLLAVSFYNSQEYLRSLTLFQKTERIQLLKDTVEYSLWYNLALTAIKAGAAEPVNHYFKQCIEVGYKEDTCWMNLTQWYLDQNQPDQALQFLSEARHKFPDNESLLTLQINVYLMLEDWEKALENLDLAIERTPNKAILYFARGSIYDALGNSEQAELNYKDAIRYDSGFFDAYYNLGALYFNQGAELINQSNDIPIDQVEEYDRVKKAGKEKLKQSLPYLENAHMINPDDMITMKSLRSIYQMTGEMEKYRAINAKIKN